MASPAEPQTFQGGEEYEMQDNDGEEEYVFKKFDLEFVIDRY